MANTTEFYIGKKGALYYHRENGGLLRFGVRVNADTGVITVFDQLTRQWYELPDLIPDRSGGSIKITLSKESS